MTSALHRRRLHPHRVCALALLAVLVLTAAAGCGRGQSTSSASPSPSYSGASSASAIPTPSPSPLVDGPLAWMAGQRSISGGEGVVLAATDDWAHWRMQVSGAAGDLRDICFVDALHGWAVGGAGTIVATGDGGRTWQAQKIPGGYNELWGVSFVDPRHGWAVGGVEGHPPGTILSTNDGGQTWRIQRSRGDDLTAVAFADRRHGWALVATGGILATDDGGRHWRRQPADVPTYAWPPGAAVTFVDARHGWAVGEAGDGVGLIMATTDGGAHWTQQSRPKAQYGLYSVSFADADRGCVGGGSGVILTTRDGGATWTRHRVRHEYKDGSGSYPVDDAFVAVARFDDERMWAVSEGGLTFSSDDGGATWTERHGLTRATIKAAAFIER